MHDPFEPTHSGVCDEEVRGEHRCTRQDAARLLDDVVERVDGVLQAVVLSTDGLLITCSADVRDERAGRLSALASAIFSLARSTAAHLEGGDVRQLVVEMDDLVLLVTAVGIDARLALLTTSHADLQCVGYELGVLEQRLGPALPTRLV